MCVHCCTCSVSERLWPPVVAAAVWTAQWRIAPLSLWPAAGNELWGAPSLVCDSPPAEAASPEPQPSASATPWYGSQMVHQPAPPNLTIQKCNIKLSVCNEAKHAEDREYYILSMFSLHGLTSQIYFTFVIIDSITETYLYLQPDLSWQPADAGHRDPSHCCSSDHHKPSAVPSSRRPMDFVHFWFVFFTLPQTLRL